MNNFSKTCLIILTALFITSTSAFVAKAQLSFGASASLFNYVGSGTAEATVYIPASNRDFYVLNPYGKKTTASYGFYFQLQSFSSSNAVIGLRLGYDVLRSENKEVYPMGSINDYQPINGSAPAVNSYDRLINQFIDINPYFGRRFVFGHFSIVPTVGAELGIGTQSNEKIHFESGNNTTDESDDRPIQHIDWRIKPGIAFNYRRVGLDISYAHGLSNYIRNNSADVTGEANHAVYSQLWRASLTFMLY